MSNEEEILNKDINLNRLDTTNRNQVDDQILNKDINLNRLDTTNRNQVDDQISNKDINLNRLDTTNRNQVDDQILNTDINLIELDITNRNQVNENEILKNDIKTESKKKDFESGKPVGLIELYFTYATRKEKILIVLAMLFSILSGVAKPLLSLFLGSKSFLTFLSLKQLSFA